MFSFLGLRKESKKLPSEKETDGGFVIVGKKKTMWQFTRMEQVQLQPHRNEIFTWRNLHCYHFEALFSE